MELIVIAILLTVTGAQQTEMEGPQNSVSVVGSNVTLKLSTPSRNCNGVHWQKATSQNTYETVFKDSGGGIFNAYRDRYSVDNSSGCDLFINDVKLTDAGRFACSFVISQRTAERDAYLIILKTPPKCGINASLGEILEGDGVQLTCEVTYNGTVKASVLWEGVEDAPDAVENGKTLSRSYTVVASAPEVPSFTCETSFEVIDNGTKIVSLASNIPTTSCKTSVIKVLYSVRNVTLSPSLSVYPPGTTITCMARGHPPPSFKWQVLEMENEGTWMDIQNQTSNQYAVTNVTSRRYRCVALNVVRGKSHNATSHEFQVNNTDEIGTFPVSTTTVDPSAFFLTFIVPIAVGVGVGFLVLVILLTICFCVRSCPGYKCCHSEKKSKDKIREAQPLRECPGEYGNSSEMKQAPKAKPRSAPTSEPPKRPEFAPPQAKPRTDIPKGHQAQPYEEVTYAELAKDTAPRQVITKNNNIPEESVYADVTTA